MQNIRYARVIKLTHALSEFSPPLSFLSNAELQEQCKYKNSANIISCKPLTDTQQGVLDHGAVQTISL